MKANPFASEMADYHELTSIIRDCPLIHPDINEGRNEQKHRATCEKNRAKRKKRNKHKKR